MYKFLVQEDFSVQVRDEILSLLDNSTEQSAIKKAEDMAIAQIKQHLGSRYDTATIFAQQDDNRDMYVVMITIDLMLYHLWSKKAPRKIPAERAQRYQDAINWLRDAGTGKITAELPQIPVEDYTGEIIVSSLYKPNCNKF